MLYTLLSINWSKMHLGLKSWTVWKSLLNSQIKTVYIFYSSCFDFRATVSTLGCPIKSPFWARILLICTELGIDHFDIIVVWPSIFRNTKEIQKITKENLYQFYFGHNFFTYAAISLTPRQVICIFIIFIFQYTPIIMSIRSYGRTPICKKWP